MIAKKFRLTEKEIKKVFKQKKPFFSRYWIVNTRKNNLQYNRIAILLSGKCTKGAVNRNFFRRKFYDTLFDIGLEGGFDLVFVPKKGQKFDFKISNDTKRFGESLSQLYTHILNNS
ncbi:ribonuclease P protein component [Candidatus Gracilibacteria bacterium]|nr:MAG: ribonuclease P protein component [Candidatus Gracilibacteria bacterium]